MKRLVLIFAALLLSINTLSAQSLATSQIKAFVESNLRNFPKSTLQDLYKSFFQSVYGPEHLVTDSAKVIAYIEQELQQDFNNDYPVVQNVGVNGRYVRLNLSVVKNGRVPASLLARCFIRSSQTKGDMPIEEFRSQWRQVVDYIISSGIQLENFSQDSLYIENILAKGQYVWVHSPQYKAAYKPHYRILSDEIFADEILPLIMEIKTDDEETENSLSIDFE